MKTETYEKGVVETRPQYQYSYLRVCPCALLFYILLCVTQKVLMKREHQTSTTNLFRGQELAANFQLQFYRQGNLFKYVKHLHFNITHHSDSHAATLLDRSEKLLAIHLSSDLDIK